MDRKQRQFLRMKTVRYDAFLTDDKSDLEDVKERSFSDDGTLQSSISARVIALRPAKLFVLVDEAIGDTGYNNKSINNNTSKREARGTIAPALDACSVRAFNLHGINRVSGRARNANTRYVYALGPSSDRRRRASLSPLSLFLCIASHCGPVNL